jgi:hypothetical protein
MTLLALALRDRPVTDTGVWLTDPPKPGTAVVAPLEVRGETQAPEGVLRVELFVVRGDTVTSVDVYEPRVPVGTVPFELTWDPAGARPGRVTIRVVATTLRRGFDAEAEGLVVPRPEAKPRAPRVRETPRTLPEPAPSRPRVVLSRPVTRAVAAPALDDSGRAFGAAAPTLPYAPPPVRLAAPAARAPVALPAAAAPPAERSGWVSLAGGLLLLLVCSHLHRVLRPQPDLEGRP